MWSAQFGTDGTRRITGDLNKPMLGVLGGSAVRLNAMGQQSGVAGRPFAEFRRWGVAPSVSVGLNTKTRATLNYVHLQDERYAGLWTAVVEQHGGAGADSA